MKDPTRNQPSFFSAIAFTCLFFLSATACKKDNYSLPPETQTGAGTFGCKIDGKVWVPRGTDYNSGRNIFANYQFIYPSPNGFVFVLSAASYESSPLEGFTLGTDSLTIKSGMLIKLCSGKKAIEGAARFHIGFDQAKEYITNDRISGELHITKFDETNLIVSGTFWFDAINPGGEIIHVTEGRFDTKYTR
jgi:hypothetical protein